MSADHLPRRLEAYLQEECGAQTRLAGLLEEHVQRLVRGKPEEILEAMEELDLEIRTSAARSARRDRILEEFAKVWEVAPGSLTLSSIAERLGPDGRRLHRMRTELREVTARVVRLARRSVLQCKYQHRLFRELIEGILWEETGSTDTVCGGLVDAEA